MAKKVASENGSPAVGLRVSDQAVRRATGRGWDEWIRWLDDRGAARLSHQEIVALLLEQGGVESGWWQQMLTVGYERAKGRRVEGQTADTGFQIGVSRTIPLPAEEVWRRLTGPGGVRAWLGDAPALRFEPGEQYRLSDGTTGEIRVAVAGDRLRVTRRPDGWARAATIQIRLAPKGEKTVVTFHEENLPSADEREARRAHYQAAFEAIFGG
ncbi:MAG TPA: SRPBCC domain-containing protein [Longimicrobiales bacterium]